MAEPKHISIPQEKRAEWLHEYWRNPSNAAGLRGADPLFSTLKAGGYDFTRKEVRDALRMETTSQIHRQQQHHRVVRPIRTSQPFAHIQFDVTNMPGSTHPFILNAVDLYTKFAWSQAYKTAVTVERVKSFITEQILPTIARTKYKWRIFQSDNGPEMQVPQKLLEPRGVKVIHSLPYHSTSQGAIEVFNKTLKQYLGRYMTEHNTRDWYPALKNIISNYNNTVHSVTGVPPSDVFGIGFHPTYKQVRPQPDNLPPIKVGDHVRIGLNTTSEVVRDQFRKGYLPNYCRYRN